MPLRIGDQNRMTNGPVRQWHVFIIAALALFPLVSPAASQTPVLFCTLSNFDVFNDTGQETHGFEIELDGITSKDVSFTFGSPYQRYGNPLLTDFAGGVFVRYQSSYDSAKQAFTTGTPIPPAITPTAGHSCWTGGAPGYLTSGCEHFGMALFKAASSATYHWLIADPATPSVLKPFGTSVSIAVPAWTVSPAPVAGGAPVVQANLPPPEAPPAQFGNAVWVKVFENEVADQVELHHLVTDDPAVPQNIAQMETEWALSQSNPKKPDLAVLHHGKPLGKGNQSVIRRYEFYYKYTGAYDPLTHEAICGGGECKTPAPEISGTISGHKWRRSTSDPRRSPKSRLVVFPTMRVEKPRSQAAPGCRSTAVTCRQPPAGGRTPTSWATACRPFSTE